MHDDEDVIAREPRAHAIGVGDRLGRVVSPDQDRAEAPALELGSGLDLPDRRDRGVRGTQVPALDRLDVHAEVIAALVVEGVGASEHRGERADRAHVHGALASSREADPDLDERASRGEEHLCELLDLRAGQTGDRGDVVERVTRQNVLAERFVAHALVCEEWLVGTTTLVGEARQAERQRRVRSRAYHQAAPTLALERSDRVGAVDVDRGHRNPAPAQLAHLRLQVLHRALHVDAPQDEGVGLDQGLDVGADHVPQHGLVADRGRSVADAPVGLGGAERVKDALRVVATDEPHAARVAQREDLFTAQRSDPLHDRLEGALPRDRLEAAAWTPQEWYPEAFRGRHQITVDGGLATQRALRIGVRGITAYTHETARVVRLDQHAAGVGTIERTGGRVERHDVASLYAAARGLPLVLDEQWPALLPQLTQEPLVQARQPRVLVEEQHDRLEAVAQTAVAQGRVEEAGDRNSRGHALVARVDPGVDEQEAVRPLRHLVRRPQYGEALLEIGHLRTQTLERPLRWGTESRGALPAERDATGQRRAQHEKCELRQDAQSRAEPGGME